MVAAVSEWHPHHERANTAINRHLGHGERLFLAGPSLVEAFSVLTRLPPPHRLSPTVALALLEASFISTGTIVTLDGAAYLALLRRGPADRVAGGRIYDAVIAECALSANVAALLTFNAGHFQMYASRGVRIVVP